MSELPGNRPHARLFNPRRPTQSSGGRRQSPTMRLLIGLGLLASLTAASLPLSEKDRREVIENSADLMEQRYVDPSLGRKIASKLRSSTNRWSGIGDPKVFAKSMTEWLRTESKDGHLGLSYSVEPIPAETSAPDFSEDMKRWYGPQLNHGVEKIERLPGNIMLLDLRVFPPSEMAGDVFAAAMTVVAQGDALILDLRQNGGGGETGNLLMGYLLPGGSQLSGQYDRPTDTTTYYSSPDWVPGRRFGSNKPLYILVSNKTFSAAEAVAYNLQTLKRATIVGERTGGGAHPFEYRRVHSHFSLDLPEARSTNPITGGNWQGVGVRPDVEVPADKALDRALELARAAAEKSK